MKKQKRERHREFWLSFSVKAEMCVDWVNCSSLRSAICEFERVRLESEKTQNADSESWLVSILVIHFPNSEKAGDPRPVKVIPCP